MNDAMRPKDHMPAGPVPGTIMHPAYAGLIAKLAYVWGWPLVNMHNRREVFRRVPSITYVGGAPMAPPNHLAMYSDYVDALQRHVAHPNQDVVYGFGIVSPGESPAVLQVPDFGDRFWVYAFYDQRTDEVAEIGRQYGTAPGFYLITDDEWRGEVPAGISGVFKLSTSMGVIVPRVFMDDTAQDREAIQQVISQIALYPLASFDGRMKVTDWRKIPSVPSPADGQGEMKWVEPGKFFDQLGAVLDEVPPLPGEEALYGQMRSLLAAAAADTAVKAAMVEAAAQTETELVDEFFRFSNVGVLLPGNWTRGFNGAAFGTDYLTRLAMAKSNIFVNRTEETVYFYQYRDASGRRLNGENRYTLTFAKGALPPVRGFWSLTMYDEHHFFQVNDLKRYSLGTKNKTLRFADDGSLTIYLQKDRPAEDLVSNWLPSPMGAFGVTIRAYWPDEPLVRGAWVPPAIERVGPAQDVLPELQALSDRAYLYAYGIDKAYQHLYETMVQPGYPANRFQIIRHLADDRYTAHPTINNDTLHLMGWLDVAAEPVIVSVPDHDDGRYWLLHTMDMGHYTTSLFGKRTRGAKGGRFMFANRAWKGEVPDGVTEVVRVESNFLKLMGRVMATGVEDEKKALSYVDDWNIRTLSEFLGQNGPKPKVRQYVPPSGNSWLERVNFVLADSTMASADARWLEGLEESGIGAGRNSPTPEQLAAAEISEQRVVERLKEILPTLTNATRSLGTREELGRGDRLLFQAGTYIGQWGAPPVEASYIQMVKDQNGDALNGANDYAITFTPPNVSQFWSVTAYGSRTMLMIANDLNRHSRGDRHVKLNADGTVTLRLSHDAKGKGEDTNFLPVPNEGFYLVLRMYGGDEQVQAGKFPVPVVQKLA